MTVLNAHLNIAQNVVRDLICQKKKIAMKNEYEKALQLACEFWGDGNCPLEEEFEFRGCLKDDCKSESIKCWFNYFLEKADERSEQ